MSNNKNNRYNGQVSPTDILTKTAEQQVYERREFVVFPFTAQAKVENPFICNHNFGE